MPSNTVWRIAFGSYEFALDRQTLTYDLRETETGTVWADALPVGWIELEDRSTGERLRYDFAAARLVSVVEKSSHQGKRILLGLDLLGIPIDLYFICGAKEVQLTVEASRDSRTHTIQNVGLFPRIVQIPDDNGSYGVVPLGEGRAIFAGDAPASPIDLPIWGSGAAALAMPFVGVVRGSGVAKQSALALLTDSAYGCFTLHRMPGGPAYLDLSYARDPERRRLELRVVPLPAGDHVAIARAYREKLIVDRAHITLRRKIRDRADVAGLVGAVFLDGPEPSTLRDILPERHRSAIYAFATDPADADQPVVALFESEGLQERPSRWDDMSERLSRLEILRAQHPAVGLAETPDWAAVAIDFWSDPAFAPDAAPGRVLPLRASIYHDSVVEATAFRDDWRASFLRSLIGLTLPRFTAGPAELWERRPEIERIVAVLSGLHALAFPAFLTEHRFLTADRSVEEAAYSDRTRIIVNAGSDQPFEQDDLLLPPGGFFVRHPQMEAHDALRVGGRPFTARAWRIRRSYDGKPLETSEDVRHEEFPV
jgi:hypothetical protein